MKVVCVCKDKEILKFLNLERHNSFVFLWDKFGTGPCFCLFSEKEGTAIEVMLLSEGEIFGENLKHYTDEVLKQKKEEIRTQANDSLFKFLLNPQEVVLRVNLTKHSIYFSTPGFDIKEEK